ncbi:unnamed protein product [Mycetohabitans rhizoxinica HKI 454]|uniref:Uncharacterized protein n=1 Tax=Mycetohabitans rhizoxinica (strain DSM 19002 / CIP 109453 / HKI 454) TaxID=882378 RepID=E5AMQ3_MYCRK|nr:unnamed protein product [Mycetohabitans rhizoxinica HKI 454]
MALGQQGGHEKQIRAMKTIDWMAILSAQPSLRRFYGFFHNKIIALR